MDDNRGLWRGKRVDNNGWVCGVPLQHCDGDWQLISGKVGAMIIDTIIPSTLGECTCLRDNNDKLIFEGDIIKTKKYGKVVGNSNVSDYDTFVVKYETTMFRLVNHNRGFIFVDDGYSTYEVIGNIHDVD